MGMFVHGDRDEKQFFEQQDAMETLGIKAGDLAVHRADVIAPPTVKDVLLKTWAQDTEKMATNIIWLYYDAIRNAFILPNGKVVWLVDAAIKEYDAYLNSAAEVEK